MKIGIIGAGNIGVGLGKRLTSAGHDIAISFAHTPEKVKAAAEAIGGSAVAVSPHEAAEHGDVVIVATPWGVTLDIVLQVADKVASKIVWDTTNPLKPDMSGLDIGTTTSGGEHIARTAPGAKVVKAIPPFADVLESDSTLIDGTKPTVFVCADDDQARATILGLIGDIGATPVNAGPLTLARYTEPLGMLLVQLAYFQGMGPRIGCSLLQDRM
jgi:predicted dinucleotide-binding enzyme